MHKQSLSPRKAGISDIPLLLELINGFAADGVMLPRTEFEMSEHIRDFTVVSDGGRMVGCAALHIYTPTHAEVRSLAVAPEYQKHGVGRLLMEAVEAEGRELGLHALFAFTYVERFFFRMGYQLADRGELPLKVWRDCIHCKKFHSCDEVAVIRWLQEPTFAVTAEELMDLIQIEVPVVRR